MGSITSFATISVGSIGWDSPVDLSAFEKIKTLPSGLSLDESYALVNTFYPPQFYGLLIQQLAEFFHHFFAGKTSWNFDNPFQVFRWQGLVTLAISIFSIAAMSSVVAFTLKSKIAGSFAWAVCMTIPLWVGLSAIDLKDIPLAAGITLASSGLVLLLNTEKRKYVTTIATCLLAFGYFVAIASRPGSWPLLLTVTIGSTFLFFLWMRIKAVPIIPPIFSAAISIFTSASIALFLLFLTNPFAKIDLFRWLWDSFTFVKKFPAEGFLRVAGLDVPLSSPPYWYVGAWIFAQLPFMTFIAVIISLIIIPIGWMRQKTNVSQSRLISFIPFGFQGIVLPSLAILSGATVYDAIRHFVFIVPALAVLLSAALWTLSHSYTDKPKVIAGVHLVSVFLVGLNLFACIRWFPYEYSFINPIASAEKMKTNWQLDYWALSLDEGIQKLQNEGIESIEIYRAIPPKYSLVNTGVKVFDPDATNENEFAVLSFLPQFPLSEELDSRCSHYFDLTRDGSVIAEAFLCNKVQK